MPSDVHLKITLMNDLHIEPEYSSKFDDYKSKHQERLKLVPFHKQADLAT